MRHAQLLLLLLLPLLLVVLCWYWRRRCWQQPRCSGNRKRLRKHDHMCTELARRFSCTYESREQAEMYKLGQVTQLRLDASSSQPVCQMQPPPPPQQQQHAIRVEQQI
jgi:hypothetical protein